MSQYVGSKWRKTAALMRNDRLKPHIPKTVRYGPSQLDQMLRRFGMVYAKPVSGKHGIGVLRVERASETYRLRYGRRTIAFRSFAHLCEAIRALKREKPYLIQKGIRLLKYGGRPFDLRVMAQRSPARKWETTGVIGRVAGPRRIVTNYHAGGKLISAERLLRGHLPQGKLRGKIRELEKIGEAAGRAMIARFPGVREIGVDAGLDQSKKIWIIEVNTAPDPYIFRAHPDPSVFRKIRRYAKAYGRRKSGKRRKPA